MEPLIRSISSRGRALPPRDFAATEQRRMRAADLFEQDVIPAEIARQMGVSHQIASDWRTVWRQHGRDGPPGVGRAGRRPKLAAEQLDQVEAALAKGPEANGYTTDLWTWRRVVEVIEQTQASWFLTGHTRLADALRSALRRGELPQVVSAAAGYGEQGAAWAPLATAPSAATTYSETQPGTSSR